MIQYLIANAIASFVPTSRVVATKPKPVVRAEKVEVKKANILKYLPVTIDDEYLKYRYHENRPVGMLPISSIFSFLNELRNEMQPSNAADDYEEEVSRLMRSLSDWRTSGISLVRVYKRPEHDQTWIAPCIKTNVDKHLDCGKPSNRSLFSTDVRRSYEQRQAAFNEFAFYTGC